MASIPASHAHDEALSWELASAAGASNERASNEPSLAPEQPGDLSDARVLTWELGVHRALWGDGACGELGDSEADAAAAASNHSLPSPSTVWPTTSSSRSFPGGDFQVGLATANSKDELGGGNGGGRPLRDSGGDWPSGTLVSPQGKGHAARQTPYMAGETPGAGGASVWVALPLVSRLGLAPASQPRQPPAGDHGQWRAAQDALRDVG
jgi:hypothetical protein